MTLVVAQEVPASSSMAVPHGPAGVRKARHCMRDELRESGMSDAVIDDAVLILSELLSNAYRHGRPLPASHPCAGTAGAEEGDVLAAWEIDRRGRLTVEVTDGGGPTRPVPATPSVTAHGGRGLSIITALSENWGVRDEAHGEVTVWALVSRDHRHEDFATRISAPALPLADLGFADAVEEFGRAGRFADGAAFGGGTGFGADDGFEPADSYGS